MGSIVHHWVHTSACQDMAVMGVAAWEQEPGELEVRDNPECGLRLILTFAPQTNFLVPLDRCIALARTALAPGSALPPPIPPCLHGGCRGRQCSCWTDHDVCVLRLTLAVMVDSSTEHAWSWHSSGVAPLC